MARRITHITTAGSAKGRRRVRHLRIVANTGVLRTLSFGQLPFGIFEPIGPRHATETRESRCRILFAICPRLFRFYCPPKTQSLPVCVVPKMILLGVYKAVVADQYNSAAVVRSLPSNVALACRLLAVGQNGADGDRPPAVKQIEDEYMHVELCLQLIWTHAVTEVIMEDGSQVSERCRWRRKSLKIGVGNTGRSERATTARPHAVLVAGRRMAMLEQIAGLPRLCHTQR